MEFHQGYGLGVQHCHGAYVCVGGRGRGRGGADGQKLQALLGAGYLAVAAYGLPALLTRAGIEGLEAGHAVGALLPQDVLLAKERLFAMVAVKALHFDTWLFSDLPNRREHVSVSTCESRMLSAGRATALSVTSR